MTSYNDGIYAQGTPDQSVTEIALDALILEGHLEGSIADRQYAQASAGSALDPTASINDMVVEDGFNPHFVMDPTEI